MPYTDVKGVYGGIGAYLPPNDPSKRGPKPRPQDYDSQEEYNAAWNAWYKSGQSQGEADRVKREYAEQEAQKNNYGETPPGLDPVESFVYGGQPADMPDWYGAEAGRVGAVGAQDQYGLQGDVDRQMDWARVARERSQGRWLQSSMAYDAAKRAAQSGAESYARSGGYGSSLARRAAQEMSLAGQGMAGERAQAEQLERDQWAKQYAQWMADAQKASFADAELRNQWAMQREGLLGDLKGQGLLQGQRRQIGAIGTLQARTMGAADALNLAAEQDRRKAAMYGKFAEGGAGVAATFADWFKANSGGSGQGGSTGNKLPTDDYGWTDDDGYED